MSDENNLYKPQGIIRAKHNKEQAMTVEQITLGDRKRIAKALQERISYFTKHSCIETAGQYQRTRDKIAQLMPRWLVHPRELLKGQSND